MALSDFAPGATKLHLLKQPAQHTRLVIRYHQLLTLPWVTVIVSNAAREADSI
jgi:hypothetical protein